MRDSFKYTECREKRKLISVKLTDTEILISEHKQVDNETINHINYLKDSEESIRNYQMMKRAGRLDTDEFGIQQELINFDHNM